MATLQEAQEAVKRGCVLTAIHRSDVWRDGGFRGLGVGLLGDTYAVLVKFVREPSRESLEKLHPYTTLRSGTVVPIAPYVIPSP